ncbi:MAG: FKBP-type peptidyl-prolyl cis-trans isomerase [Fluviicola sp.]|jgi:FKBP-type peptidyl-prolyl cis-trans isomerase
MSKKNLLILLSISFFVFSCGEEEKPKTIPNWNQEKSTELHQNLSEQEDIDIQLYLANVEPSRIVESGSGLRYISVKPGSGRAILDQETAGVRYSVKLLDGKKCYETEKGRLDIFKVNHSDIESGILEGIRNMHIGEKARLVFPSHLAHGLLGDMDKIPPLSPLVVDIELVEIK